MNTETIFESTTLKNLVTGQSLFLSETGNDYILDGKPDFSQVDAKINYIGYVNQIGSQATSTSLEPRPINIIGWIVAGSIKDMKRKKKFLNSFVNPFQEMRCEYEGYYIDFIPDASIKYAKEYDKNNEVMCNFEISGTCGVPLFTDLQKTTIKQSSSYPIAVFPMEIPLDEGIIFGIAGEDAERVVTNKGTVDSWFSLKIVCLQETIQNPKITLKDSESFIQIKTTLEKNDELFISTEYGKEIVKVIRSDGSIKDLMTAVTRDSDLFLLPQGENTLVISDDIGKIENIDFMIEFSPLYMEVQ